MLTRVQATKFLFESFRYNQLPLSHQTLSRASILLRITPGKPKSTSKVSPLRYPGANLPSLSITIRSYLQSNIPDFTQESPVTAVRIGLSGVRAPVWTVSSMRHWKKLIKILWDTDCFYCINHMTCSIHVYYCLYILFTFSAIWFTIMSHVYLILHVETHYSCTRIFCIPFILCFMYSL